MRPRSPISLTLLALAAHCGAAAPGAMRERIGGAMRERAFASPTAYEAYLRGELAAARGQRAEAAAQLDLAVVADPSDAFLAARRVELLLARGDGAEALRAAEALVRQHPDAAAGWLALAQARAAGNDPRGADDALRRASAADPDDPEVRASVALFSGGSPAEVARARRDAPMARDGDRTLARGALLDPASAARRGEVTRRRLAAIELRARGDWAGVDRALSPLALRDPSDLSARLAVIEARARDGRPRDAAALVATLPHDDVALPLARRARAWWLVGEHARGAELASEALARDPGDALALRVKAQCLGALGDVAGALTLLARVPVDAPWEWAGELSRDAWGSPGRDLIDASGRDVSDAHRAYASARRLAATLLARGGRRDLGDRVLARALDALDGLADAATSRDALRLGRAEFLDASARDAALATMETAWGRHRRGVLRAAVNPAGADEDLAARSGDAFEDAAADAWRARITAPSRGRPDTNAR